MTTAAPPPGDYQLRDHQYDEELARLEALERLVDAHTFASLDQIPIRSGWNCLDLGAGAGSVARELKRRVSTTGSVVAADLDTRFLSGERAEGLEVEVLDVRRDRLDRGRFDLVHCRSVLQHLPDAESALAEMAGSLRPGGWLVIEDVDFLTLCLPGSSRDNADQVYETVQRLFALVGDSGRMRPTMGRELVALARAAGLVEIACEVSTRYSDVDEETNVATGLLRTLAPVAVGAGVISENESRLVLDFLDRAPHPVLGPLMFCIRARQEQSDRIVS